MEICENAGSGEIREGGDWIQKRLFELRDENYKSFHCRLIPTVDPDTVIGVRTPALRKLAKELAGTPAAEAFLRSLPHKYYDENNLHGFLIEAIKDYDACLAALNEFLPYADNWATCDLMSPKSLKKNLPDLLEQVRKWMASDRVYTIRYGLNTLMRFYMEDAFEPQQLELAASVKSQEYYVHMAVAWYFATALAKQYDAALPFIEKHRLEMRTHNKTIQKAVESRRLTDEQKAYLKTQKRKSD